MAIKKDTPPLIVVSNRLPFVLRHDEKGQLQRKPNAGGLVTALAPIVMSYEGIWIGWSGMYNLPAGTKIPECDPSEQTSCMALKSSQIMSVELKKEIFDKFYLGCCNGTLWPLFHSMPDRVVFRADTWQAYCEVNEEFARKTIISLRKALGKSPIQHLASDKIPIIWVHDYHLFTATSSIRRIADKENLVFKLGFFLHIPFPSWDILRILPWKNSILKGMLACDVIGFHVKDYCLNFLDCCDRILGCEINREEMSATYNGKKAWVKAQPIGIPFNSFEQLALSAPLFVKDFKKVKMIVGVDRLDYTKGIVNRILAFERLLEKHPKYIEHVTLFQVAVPSRTDLTEYKNLKEEIDRLIGRVNGRFSKPNWSPVRYIYGFVKQEDLAALYRDSAVALITPLRDGMNLVAKEFVACQVNDPGVLVLSEFAGAANTMQKALVVNPYEVDSVAAAVDAALRMPLEMRHNRMSCLRKTERLYDIDFWMDSFLHSMSAIEVKQTNHNKRYTHSNDISNGKNGFGCAIVGGNVAK